MSDEALHTRPNIWELRRPGAEPRRVRLVDTGEAPQTGGGLKAVGRSLEADEPFCFTYGDGLAAIDVTALIAFHRAHGRLATVTAVTPPARFGALETEGERVTHFREKPVGDGGGIHRRFFLAPPQVLHP